MLDNILTNAKAYAALAGSLAASLLVQFGPDGQLGVVLTTIVTVAGVLAVWRVPNAE